MVTRGRERVGKPSADSRCETYSAFHSNFGCERPQRSPSVLWSVGVKRGERSVSAHIIDEHQSLERGLLGDHTPPSVSQDFEDTWPAFQALRLVPREAPYLPVMSALSMFPCGTEVLDNLLPHPIIVFAAYPPEAEQVCGMVGC
jgi:hypothetical protein